MGGDPHRAHNVRDGRCRYTFGAARCPAPGSVAVGRWWVCAAHQDWAGAPGDPLMQAEGEQALRAQEARYGALEATDGEPVGTPSPYRSNAAEAAIRAMRELLELQQASEPRCAAPISDERLARVADRAERYFLRAMRSRGQGGDRAARRAAILAAVRDIAVAAVEGRFDNG